MRAALVLIALLLASPAAAQETQMVPVTVDGETVREYMPPAGVDGHQIVTRPGLWTPALEAYLKRQGLPFSPAPP